VCRMHGASGGAPKGNRNALKHGEFTVEVMALKKGNHRSRPDGPRDNRRRSNRAMQTGGVSRATLA